MATCQATTSRSRKCKNHAQNDSRFCFFHDPKSRDARREAQRRGGRKKQRSQAELPPCRFDFDDPHKTTQLLSVVADLVYRGQLDGQTGQVIGRLSDCALRAVNAGTMADRLAKLERLLRAESALPVDAASSVTTEFEDEEDRKFRDLATSAVRRQREMETKNANDGADQPSLVEDRKPEEGS